MILLELAAGRPGCVGCVAVVSVICGDDECDGDVAGQKQSFNKVLNKNSFSSNIIRIKVLTDRLM